MKEKHTTVSLLEIIIEDGPDIVRHNLQTGIFAISYILNAAELMVVDSGYQIVFWIYFQIITSYDERL